MTLFRSVLYTMWFYGVSVPMIICGQILPLLPKRAAKPYARLWSRLVLAGLPICGIRVEITGRENLPPGGGMLVASMHQSAFDTLLWWRMVPDCRYVVKAELMKIPLFGRIARLAGQIGVDRAGGGATMRGLLRDGGRALAEGSQMVIFPEGTRVAAGTTAPLQPGIAALAIRSKVPVIPVITDSGRCWGKGVFGKRPGIIHVDIRPALPTGLARDELMRQLEKEFADGLQRF